MRLQILPLLAVLVPARAHAEGDVSFQVVDHGDSVEVIAHGLEMKNANVAPIRSRLEVPLVGAPIANRQMMADATVLQVELDGMTLSVKTKLDRPEVHELAKLATATQVGNDLHLSFPRHANIAQPAVAATKPAPAPAPKPAPAPIATPVAAAPIQAPTPAPVAIAAPLPMPPPAAKRAIPPETHRDWNSTSVFALAAFVALGIAAYMFKKKKQSAQPASTIDVVAQRALGGKAKVMWLAAGEREMIISVTGQQIRMLGQWPRGTTQVGLPIATATQNEREPEKTVSPSVAGILKLRDRYPRASTQHPRAKTHSPIANDEIATDDHDDDLIWAKEILAATHGARR